MLRTQRQTKYIKPSSRREVPPEHITIALKVSKARRKFGNGLLEQEQIDTIPGLRSITIKKDNTFDSFKPNHKES